MILRAGRWSGGSSSTESFLATTSLGRDHRVIRLAQSLGLSGRGDSLLQVKRHAVAQVEKIVALWPESIESLEELLQVVASHLSVRIEFVNSDDDVERIARRRSAYSSTLLETLRCDFLRGQSEGLLVEHQAPGRGDCRYLAVVDARGGRIARAYFTAWHEIAHVLTIPMQREFKLHRRTPTVEQIRKDPIEAVVDHIAGVLAFYDTIFGPALDREVASDGQLSFGAIERAIRVVAPRASLYAATVAAIRLRAEPLCFVCAENRLKPTEQRSLRVSGQRQLGLGLRNHVPVPRLRLTAVVANDAARRRGIRLHEHLRVPSSSALALAHLNQIDGELVALEDQEHWETTGDGALPPLPLAVTASRRGNSVYGLLRL